MNQQALQAEEALAQVLGWTDVKHVAVGTSTRLRGIPPASVTGTSDQEPHKRAAQWVPRWTADDRAAFKLMGTYLAGYYETRRGDPDHCIVIGNDTAKTTVVYVRHHRHIRTALRFAIVEAVTAELRARSRRRPAAHVVASVTGQSASAAAAHV